MFAALQLTQEHRPCSEAEATRVRAIGATVSQDVDGVWRVNDCLAVTRAFGNSHMADVILADPDIVTHEVRGGCGGAEEVLVIATDGLWDCVPPSDVVRLEPLMLSNIAGKLLETPCASCVGYIVGPGLLSLLVLVNK